MKITDTICALSTPQGVGAIAVIRISGKEAFPIVSNLFKTNSHFNSLEKNHAQYMEIWRNESLIDQVVVVKFEAPHSFTGENIVEISCHGSLYIQKTILEMLISWGARMANPGEFSMRAFLHNKLDLPQTEAIADLIDSQSETSHKLAVSQLKGGFSHLISEIRKQVVELTSLLELELDFSEEDVQFADRKRLLQLLAQLKTQILTLTDSFKLGNVIKNGIPVAIIGKPNVGKSTLLNALTNEERAIVSHIPGTTRDTIEDVMSINGIQFRFIDTAGIRQSHDEIEQFGIERTFKAIQNAEIILFLIDLTHTTKSELEEELCFLENKIDVSCKKIIIVGNKIDEVSVIPEYFISWEDYDMLFISAKREVNIENIKEALISHISQHQILDNTLITNIRHYDILSKIELEIDDIEIGFAQSLPIDLIAIHLQHILHYLGEITGEITTDEILNNIFGRFCIGK